MKGWDWFSLLMLDCSLLEVESGWSSVRLGVECHTMCYGLLGG